MKKILLGLFLSTILFACNNQKEEAAATPDAVTTTDAPKTGDEILAMSEGDEAKNSLMAFSKGDVNGMTALYDDNAKFYWSGGDSLTGKKAIHDYYAGRLKLIESSTISQQIVLPVRVNVSQSPTHTLGKWVLVWSNISVKYKNGKSLTFWTHSDYHYNDAGKVDIAVYYIDRHPIMEATKGM